MKRLLTLSFLFITLLVNSQEKTTIYNPNADAKVDLKNAIAQAKAEKKHVLIQVGGNWCSWCIKFHKFATTEAKIDSIIKADYVYLLLNWSKENKNPEVMKTLQYPNRFGFPVFVILDGKGNLIHTQASDLLELEKGYDPKKVTTFLLQWNVKALDPNTYLEKK